MSNTYPCIKEFTGSEGRVVVLFSEPKGGTVIQSPCDSDFLSVGDYLVGWDESKFQPFNESITLNNEVLNNAE